MPTPLDLNAHGPFDGKLQYLNYTGGKIGSVIYIYHFGNVFMAYLDNNILPSFLKNFKFGQCISNAGKMTSQQIKAGYKALKIIDMCISNDDYGQRLVQACNDFYTRIPHDFG